MNGMVSGPKKEGHCECPRKRELGPCPEFILLFNFGVSKLTILLRSCYIPNCPTQFSTQSKQSQVLANCLLKHYSMKTAVKDNSSHLEFVESKFEIGSWKGISGLYIFFVTFKGTVSNTEKNWGRGSFLRSLLRRLR